MMQVKASLRRKESSDFLKKILISHFFEKTSIKKYGFCQVRRYMPEFASMIDSDYFVLGGNRWRILKEWLS